MMRHLKDENEMEEPQIGGLVEDRIQRISQREGMFESQQMKNETYISGLGLPEAFWSLFWIKNHVMIVY